jgi:hypothetical protein
MSKEQRSSDSETLRRLVELQEQMVRLIPFPDV